MSDSLASSIVSSAKLELEDVPCPLCGSIRRDRSLTTRDHEYESTPRMSFTLQRCADCQLYYLSPRPALRELSKIYPPEYLNFHTDEEAASSSPLRRLLRKASVREISNWLQTARYRKLLQRYTAFTASDAPRVLDVGCGDGYVLNLLKQVVPAAETFGVEVDPAAAGKAARRHRVVVGDFLAVQIDGLFDLIVSSHVIEHVADPLAFLRRIEKLLAPGGVAIIDTPNIETPLFRLFGRHWGGIHAPRHWALFSAPTITALAKHAGLAISDIVYMPIQCFWVWSIHSALYDRARRLADRFFHPQACVNKPSLYYTGLMTFLQALERATQVFDRRLGQMRVIMKRPAN
jgi:SAM-dependent methyltransferase